MNPFRNLHSQTAGLILILILGSLVAPLLAFSPPRDTAGPLTVQISDPGEVRKLGEAIGVQVTLSNSAALPLTGMLRISLTDGWRVQGDAERKFTLGSKATQKLDVQVVPATNSYAALYPFHARAEFRAGDAPPATAHAILILSVAQEAVATKARAVTEGPILKVPQRGRIRLDATGSFQPSIATGGTNPVAKPIGWNGSDADTGGSVQLTEVDRGDRRRTIGVHPPYRKGWGDLLLDYRIALPQQTPIHLHFATAIRDHSATEPASDGVEFRVQVSDGGAFKDLFARFSAAKQWESAQVDLSAYAGREITLRLFTGPGPKHNTTCDQAYWAEPIIVSGPAPQAEPAAQHTARRERAIQLARLALAGKSADWSWRLQSEAATTGAALVPGPSGVADAFIAFAEADRTLVFEGFTVEVDGQSLGTGRTDLPVDRVDPRFAANRGVLNHVIFKGDLPVNVRAEVWAENGALRVAFSMPGVQRDLRGEPHFSNLMIGPASEKAPRVYAGFGNVIQAPGRFDLRAGGFTLSTRHVGMDFANGLSLVQASDIYPDAFRVDPDQRRYSLATHHDATLSFLPSTRGAFAAARAYRQIAGFKPAPGVKNIVGRMCLDEWGGDYRKAAEGIERAARYGLTNSVFVKHAWQRWGYDYRLPEIYPPSGSYDDFRAMVDACKRNGILFSPHDNYIDFYPDADGYSYDHIIFNLDGTPQKAWFNKGRQALSYRWLPTAFFPWLESNLKQIKAGFAPDSYFVDVFSAIPPIDFYDRRGRFYPKTVTAECWGAAFDRIREILGNDAPMISEAGHDGLIGHLDAVQSDHSAWLPHIKDPEAHFRWSMPAADAQRVPWHDMVSHGNFVLLAGGLGHRYAGGQDNVLHGYASDDYLNLTVLGGRNPMCAGPFSRAAVMTYWLLNDVSDILARSEMLEHEFVGNDIHRQRVRFSNGGIVTANRGTNDWTVDGVVLPSFGFIARAGGVEASVTRRNGMISALARSPGLLFADARPIAMETGGQIQPRVTAVEDLGHRRFRVKMEWQVLQAIPAGYRPFMHFVSDEGTDGEGILFQGSVNLDASKLATPGRYPSETTVSLPAAVKAPMAIAIRSGLYHPQGGQRVPIAGPVDSTSRARGGEIQVQAQGEGHPTVRWQPEPPDQRMAERLKRLNVEDQVLDFGPVATSGAFRLAFTGTEWELIPLPSSRGFKVELHLDRLNASGQKVQSITALNLDRQPLGPASFQQVNQMVSFETAAAPFAYRISLH